MSTSEKTLQLAFQAALQGLADFEDGDVTINDWSILDRSMVDAPYVIIENSDTFSSAGDGPYARDDFDIPFTLCVKLGAETWKDALDQFRDTRQAIIDLANADTARSAWGQEGVQVASVRSDAPPGYIYAAEVDPETQPYATPLFISQRCVLEIRQF